VLLRAPLAGQVQLRATAGQTERTNGRQRWSDIKIEAATAAKPAPTARIQTSTSLLLSRQFSFFLCVLFFVRIL